MSTRKVNPGPKRPAPARQRNPERRFRALLFDFDGVLADTERLHCEAFRRILAEEHQPFTPQEYFGRYIHFDDRHVFLTVAADRQLGWGGEQARRLAESKRALFKELIQSPDLLYPGAADLVRREAARRPLAICSMGRRDEIEPALDRGGIRQCFSALVSCEDVRRPKPDPEPYLLCLDLLNRARSLSLRPGDCLVVEDSCGGTRSGKAAGMTVAVVTHSLTAAELQAAGADAVCDGLPDLARWLDSA